MALLGINTIEQPESGAARQEFLVQTQPEAAVEVLDPIEELPISQIGEVASDLSNIIIDQQLPAEDPGMPDLKVINADYIAGISDGLRKEPSFTTPELSNLAQKAIAVRVD